VLLPEIACTVVLRSGRCVEVRAFCAASRYLTFICKGRVDNYRTREVLPSRRNVLRSTCAEVTCLSVNLSAQLAYVSLPTAAVYTRRLSMLTGQFRPPFNPDRAACYAHYKQRTQSAVLQPRSPGSVECNKMNFGVPHFVATANGLWRPTVCVLRSLDGLVTEQTKGNDRA